MYASGMWTSHEGMRVIFRASSEIVSMLSNWEVRKLFSYLLFSNLKLHDFSFCSLVTKDELLDQYPNASDLIDKLPASVSEGCFKPEAHLLIEKFLSLKKDNSRDSYISNVMDHTRIRRLVRSIFKSGGTLMHLLINAQSFL